MVTDAQSSDNKTLKAPKPRPANPCTFVIFGITGDLTKRLLFPAICNLGAAGLLDDNFSIIGIAKEDFSESAFKKNLKSNVEPFIKDAGAKKYANALIADLRYISGDFDDSKVYSQLKKVLIELVKKGSSKNVLFYFAAPSQLVPDITSSLHKANLLDEKDDYFRRVVVEKPFGHDVHSARELNHFLLTRLKEDQIFRIDHFLGKETVQNLMTLRFANSMFEPIWNRSYIDHVQITVAETLGVEKRGEYYEHAGALRDMVPNHMFQMLSLITMEPPGSFSGDDIRAEKLKVLNAVKRLAPNQVLSHVVRGQYGAGYIDDKKVIGYREEKNVSRTSPTETYIALKLFIDNWRWLGVPFYLRTGKRMAKHVTEIIVQFKSEPACILTNAKESLPNILRIFIQPDEGISLRFNAKIPGPELKLGQVEMKFRYSDYFGIKPQTGYETILYDCMNGDHLLFNQADMVEVAWAILQPILDVWGALPPRSFPNYEAGSWGPKAAEELLSHDGRKWSP